MSKISTRPVYISVEVIPGVLPILIGGGGGGGRKGGWYQELTTMASEDLVELHKHSENSHEGHPVHARDA